MPGSLAIFHNLYFHLNDYALLKKDQAQIHRVMLSLNLPLEISVQGFFSQDQLHHQMLGCWTVDFDFDFDFDVDYDGFRGKLYCYS